MIGQFEVGDKILVTTDNWFLAPDGQMYRGVYGELHGIFNDKETLGITTNRGSTNWYAMVGNMVVAGCQIHYAIKCDECSESRFIDERWHDGRVSKEYTQPRIYFA